MRGKISAIGGPHSILYHAVDYAYKKILLLSRIQTPQRGSISYSNYIKGFKLFEEARGIYIHTTTTIYLSEIGQVILCDARKRKILAADFMCVAF